MYMCKMNAKHKAKHTLRHTLVLRASYHIISYLHEFVALTSS